MQIPRSHPFSRIILLPLIIGILYGTGCGAFTKNNPYVLNPTGRIIEQFIADMPIVDIDVLMTVSDPFRFFVLVTGEVGTDTVHHETRQTREGNTITIKMTTITTREEGVIYKAVALLYRETVIIGTLPPGDYKIIVNDVERQLRVD